MSKNKLIKQLKKKHPKLNNSDLETVVNIFLKNISNALIKGATVELRGLGRWYSKKLKQNYNSRNPSTNELIYTPERVKIRFKASKNLNKIINQ